MATSEELYSTPTPILSPFQSTSDLPITTLPPSDPPHLDLRANAAAPVAPVAPVAPAAPVNPGGAGAPAAVATTTPGQGQAPTISTVMVNTVIGGVPTQVPVVYTQTFVDVPSQGPSPLKGTIGLGTLTKEGGAGSKGGKAKRSEDTRGPGMWGWVRGFSQE